MPAGFGGFMGRFGSALNAPGTEMYNRNLLQQGAQFGAFDPMGSKRLRAIRRRRVLAQGDAQRQRGEGAAQLYGLDPMQRRAAMFDVDRSASANIAGGLNQADLEQETGAQDFLRSLYGGTLDFNRNMALERERTKQARAGGMGSAFGAIGGKIGGRLVDKFIPI